MSSAAALNWAADDADSDGEDIVRQKKDPEPAKAASAPAAAPAPAPQERREHQPREGGGRGGDRERGGERFPRRERERSPPRAPAEINPNGPFIIYISNLPHDTTESELRAYFHHASCDCHSISVPVDKVTGRGRGFAHIEFKDKATMVRALTANGKTIKGRTVTVEVGRSQGNRGDRDRDRRGDGKFGGERKDRKPESAAPAEGAAVASESSGVRKKLELAPRTKPVETVGVAAGTPSSYSSIFGGGKPREEAAAAAAAAAAAPPALPTPSAAEPAVAAITEKVGDLDVEAPAAPSTSAEKKAAPADRPERRDRVKRSEGTPRDGTTRPKSTKPSDKDGKKPGGARPGRPGSAPANGASAAKKSTPRTTTTEEGWTSAVSTSAPAKEQQAAAAPAEKKPAKNSNVFALLNEESEDEN